RLIVLRFFRVLLSLHVSKFLESAHRFSGVSSAGFIHKLLSGEMLMKAPVMLTFLVVVASVGLACGQQKPPQDLQPVIDALDKAATGMAQDPKAASFTLGLVRPGGLVWTKSYGYADIDAKKPATADTVYRVGSITKQFTALMLLQLVHEGKVHL